MGALLADLKLVVTAVLAYVGDICSTIADQATTRFVLLNGAEHGGNDWRVHKATARVEHACAQGQHHKTGVHAECRAGPSQEHEGACGHDAGLDADICICFYMANLYYYSFFPVFFQ